ncbi:MAG: HigA family addiction module antidote protein [Bacteroidales bacterium]|nr:HigA family addiction module antidote protein [Candidatus Scybalocola fimicaballi]
MVKHPGLILKEALIARKTTQKNLASMIDMQPSHLSEIIKGKRSISLLVAEKLESVLDIPASKWIQLQAEYDFEVATKTIEEDENHKAELELVAYEELYDLKLLFKKLGVNTLSATERLHFCKNDLNFDSISIQRKAVQGYFHRSEKTGLDKRMIATWSLIAMYEASQLPMPNGKFDKSACDTLAGELSLAFNDNQNTINRVTRILSSYGVKFCIVEKVPHASIDGFSFYSDGIPCIVVTKRFNRIDNLAFAILHEVGHLKLHLQENRIGKVNVIDPDEEKISKEEIEANSFAANVLIPELIWDDQPMVRLNNPQEIQREFTKFANKYHINKWIVLGRVSFETNIFMFKSDSSREIH